MLQLTILFRFVISLNLLLFLKCFKICRAINAANNYCSCHITRYHLVKPCRPILTNIVLSGRWQVATHVPASNFSISYIVELRRPLVQPCIFFIALACTRLRIAQQHTVFWMFPGKTRRLMQIPCCCRCRTPISIAQPRSRTTSGTSLVFIRPVGACANSFRVDARGAVRRSCWPASLSPCLPSSPI